MLPLALLELAEKLRLLPGIGVKSSQKMAIDILQLKPQDFEALIDSIEQSQLKVKFCSQCGFFSENFLCEICSNKRRNQNQICIVEKPTDILSLEKSEIYGGVYHVLNKLISPLDNVFAENTTISKLTDRLKDLVKKQKQQVELILFLKPSFSTEATTAYIRETILNHKLQDSVNITRLAQGLPLYYNPDTLDSATMVKALEDRREI